MQVFIPIYRVDTKNIYFGEKRKNVILDGNFVKLIYSTECFEMNGLHLVVNFLRAPIMAIPHLDLVLDQYSSKKAVRRIPNPGAICFSDTILTGSSAGVQGYYSCTRDASIVPGMPNPSRRESSGMNGTGDRAVNLYKPIEKVKSFAKVKLVTNTTPLTKPAVKFFAELDLNLVDNIRQVQRLTDIERDIIDHYIQSQAPHKIGVYNLKSQLINGSFRYSRLTDSSEVRTDYYSDSRSNKRSESANIREFTNDYYSDSRSCFDEADHPQIPNAIDGNCYVLKISGIWETSTNVGITLKFTKL